MNPSITLTTRLAAGCLATMVLAFAAHAQGGSGLPGAKGPGTFGISKSPVDEATAAVKVRLISETKELVPGKAATIGLTFELAKGWHIYWRNAGDSGLPTGFNFEVPEGVTIGEARWPVPLRYMGEGQVLDYIYEDRVTLIFPVVVSPALSPSAGSIEIKAKVDWLVCKEACFPGKTSVSLSLPIAMETSPSADAGLIAAARMRLPSKVEKDTTTVVAASLDGEVLKITSEGAREMLFFPFEGDIQPADPHGEGQSKGSTLSLTYSNLAPGTRVRGVVEARHERETFFRVVDVTVPDVPN